MRKITALFLNEMLKISKKISVLVILIIMVVGVAGFGGLIKSQENQFGSQEIGSQVDSWVFDEMKNQAQMMKDNLQVIENQLPGLPAADQAKLLEEKAMLEDQIEIYNLAIEKEIPMIGSNDYRSEALNNVIALRPTLRNLQQTPESDRTDDENELILKTKTLIDRYLLVAEQKDFREYLDIRNEQIQSDASMSADQKKIYLEGNDLWYKIDPSGGLEEGSDFENLQSAINQIESTRMALLNNLDYDSPTGMMPLTPAKREKLENNLAVMIYKLENQMPVSDYNLTAKVFAVQGMLGFGRFMIVLLMMILAGGAISQEIATGSIKSLIISPTKRWKIYSAKVLSLLFVGIAATLLLYGITMLANGIYFGFSSGEPYVYAYHGTVGELGFYLYKLLYLAIGFLDIIFYMALAFMLSIITRNTAAAVGISIAVYFGGNMASAFLSYVAKGEWMKFIPFNNLSLASDFFPYDTTSQMAGNLFGNIASAVNPSILFSMLYLVVALVCMGYIGLDSFNRRDIK